MKKIFFILILIFSLMNTKTLNSQPKSIYVITDAKSKLVVEGSDYLNPYLIASTVKILTAIVCIEYADISKSYIVTKEDSNQEGSKVYLEEGDEVSLYDALCGLLLRSGNDCANFIARNTFDNSSFFVYMMNLKAKEIGLKTATFYNPSGLDSNTKNLCSAYELSLIMCYAMNNETFYEIATKKTYHAKTKLNTYYWTNKDKLVGTEGFISGKTGFTLQSGRILVNYVIYNEHPYVIVTINESDDWARHRYLYNKLKKTKKINLIKKGIYKIDNAYHFIDDFNYYGYSDNIDLIYLNDRIVFKMDESYIGQYLF